MDEEGRHFKDFPIARFLIEDPNDFGQVKHKTFSLLPYQLIPYRKFSIPFLIKVMGIGCKDKMSVHRLQQRVFDFTFKNGNGLELCAARTYEFKSLIDQAITKLLSSGFYPEFIPRFQTGSLWEKVRIFLDISGEFYCHKVIPSIRGPCALGYDYYLSGGGYQRNHYFLFGTPSQFLINS